MSWYPVTSSGTGVNLLTGQLPPTRTAVMTEMRDAPRKDERVVRALRARIEDGTYRPGDLLPSQHDLVREFGVSRPTVIEALRVLRQEGWIETQAARGSFVRGRVPAVDHR